MSPLYVNTILSKSAAFVQYQAGITPVFLTTGLIHPAEKQHQKTANLVYMKLQNQRPFKVKKESDVTSGFERIA